MPSHRDIARLRKYRSQASLAIGRLTTFQRLMLDIACAYTLRPDEVADLIEEATYELTTAADSLALMVADLGKLMEEAQ